MQSPTLISAIGRTPVKIQIQRSIVDQGLQAGNGEVGEEADARPKDRALGGCLQVRDHDATNLNRQDQPYCLCTRLCSVGAGSGFQKALQGGP